MSGRPKMETAPESTVGVSSSVKLNAQMSGFSTSTEVNVLLWSLRILNHCHRSNGFSQLRRSNSEKETYADLQYACHQLKIPGSVEDLSTLAAVAPDLIKQIESIELPPDPAEQSINALTARCAVTSAEQKLLLFAICTAGSFMLENLMDLLLKNITMHSLYQVFSRVLNENLKEIQQALRADSFMARSGIMRLNNTRFVRDIGLDLGFGIAEVFESANGDWNQIVNQVCAPARTSTLVESSFSHLSTEWSLVMAYINGSANAGRLGANVLFYGPPGCGKTEFARAVLAASNLQGYELATECRNGQSLHPAGRRSLYRQANLYLQNESSSVLLVDEMDQMLTINNLPTVLGKFDDIWSKASANALLDSNPVPSIWITNSPGLLDSAQLRRFDLVVRFSQLSRRTIRLQLVDKLATYGLSDDWMDTVSAAPGITPGLVETLAQVAASIHKGKCGKTNMENLLSTAFRQRGIKLSRKKQKTFHIEYCNATMPAEQLTTVLQGKHDARCLLHGSTGTGKTAFARHIAKTLDLEPRLVRPSDILDMYVGGTERNIAELFETTVPEETLIILDEFESFAADRKGANRNWEVSQVNEMLTQLEAYEGRVLACTNLIDYIDPAIRRRFQLKVELLPLTSEQCIKLLRETCLKLGLTNDSNDSHLDRVTGLKNLAFGHIANAVEVAENVLDITHQGFVELLQKEIESTNGPVVRTIGFSAT